jgi:amidohydrolase
VVVPPRARRRFGFLPCSKCRLPARERNTLPRAVILNRFAADFLVLMPLGRRIKIQPNLSRKERAIYGAIRREARGNFEIAKFQGLPIGLTLSRGTHISAVDKPMLWFPPRLVFLELLILTMARGGFASSIDTSQLSQKAASIRGQVVEWRRDFHMHPELSNREERTSRMVAEQLRAFGCDEIRTNVARHGIVALLKGGQPGPVVAFRADMDALPINETMDVPYRSLVPGVKHACGHDAHTAIGLGVAELLSGMRAQIQGSVKFIFQPAEEGPPPGEDGGAALMIKERALENPKPAAIFALHTTPEVETGMVGFRAGPAQASADNLRIVLRGKMSHAAVPEKGVDTVLVAAECVSALQSIKSRRIDTFEPIIITIGTIHGGNKPNILADEVVMEGTVRTFSAQTRNRIEELIRETLGGVTSAYGATFQLEMKPITTVVYNDPKLVDRAVTVMRSVLGSSNVVEVPKRMGAEDFSYFEEVVPGFLLRLGSGNQAKGITAEAHTPQFDIDEDCLVVGVKSVAAILLDYLNEHAGVRVSEVPRAAKGAGK